MRPDTLDRLAADYTRFPVMFAGESVQADELDVAAVRVGVPLSADYREFVARFGGGHAGAFSVAGLRRWEAAGIGEWCVLEKTERFRAEKWPGTELWAVFSDDGFGNPIGLDADGRVWLSDHNSRECVCLEAGFEDWLRMWALRMDPLRGDGYLAQWVW